jgi:hypothetical protein
MPKLLRLTRAPLRLAVATGLFLATTHGAARAQATFEAQIEARSFSPVRSGDVRVDYRENTELNSRLAAEIERALIAKGFVLRNRPSMLLDFRTTVRRADTGGLRLRFYGEGGNRVGLDDFRVGVDLPDPDRATRTVHYEVAMDLIDRTARQIVWTGKGTVALQGAERFQVTSGLARRLTALIGQTASTP